MEQCYGGRYEVRAPVCDMPGGHLYEAEDLSLQRHVLVYVPAQKQTGTETRDAMLRAASFTHDDFMHVLDVGISLGNPYAVFKWCEGAPLAQQLRKHRMAADDMLARLYQLGQAMQEAAEEGMYGYSVLADSLWLGHGGRLLPIRYWEAAAEDGKGAVGLCHLLIQLCTKEEMVPENPDAAENQLRLALHGLPADRSEAVVALVARTFREKMALTAFLAELRLCLPSSSASAADGRLPSAASVPDADAAEDKARANFAVDGPLIEEKSSSSGGGRLWRRLAFIAGAACLFVIVFIGGLTLVFQLGGRTDVKNEQAHPTEQATAVDAGGAAPSVKSAPAQPEKPAPAATNPEAGSGASASGPTTIPKLIGLSRADAEKAAIAAGLHYSFNIEKSEAPQGTVFKQEPQAGGAAVRGDSVTFMVSKGK